MVVACFRSAPSSGVDTICLRKHHIAKHRARCSQLDIVCISTCFTILFQLRQPSVAADLVPCTLLQVLVCFGPASSSGCDTIFSGDIPPCSSVQVPVRAISSLEQCMFVACFRFAPSSGVVRLFEEASHREASCTLQSARYRLLIYMFDKFVSVATTVVCRRSSSVYPPLALGLFRSCALFWV